MNVDFYKFAKKANSTARPTSTPQTVGVQLKGPCSIENPVLECATRIDTNYCWIGEFGHYYFIDPPKYINGAWEYYLNVDLLATYKTEIGNSNLYVLRAASARDQYLIDNSAPVSSTMTVVTDEKTVNILPFIHGYYVISVVGENTTGQTLYQLEPAEFQQLLDDLLVTAQDVSLWGALETGIRNSLINPTQYITSCRWYPNSFTSIAKDTITAGVWQSAIEGRQIGKLILPLDPDNPERVDYMQQHFLFSVSQHPQQSSHGYYVNLSPFTRMTMSLPPFGTFDLDVSLLTNYTHIDVEIYADPFTGIGTAYGYASTLSGGDPVHGPLIFYRQTQYGAPTPLSSTGGDLTGTLMNDTIGAGASLGMGNVAGMALYFARGMVDSVKALSTVNIMSGSGSRIDIVRPKVLTQCFFNQAEIDVTHQGRPLCKNKTISTLSGFIQVAKGDISIATSDKELQEIKTLLEGGFYYE